MNKKISRLKRASRLRLKLKHLNVTRLCINKTSNNIYAQIILDNKKTSKTLIQYSTLNTNNKNSANIASAELVGKNIALCAVKKGIKNVVFDRSGFKYHGKIKALAETARKFGLKF